MTSNDIYNLCKDGEKVIESEKFLDLNYLIKNDSIVLMSENHGTFCFNFENFEELVEEIRDILTVWEGMETGKCVLNGNKKRGNNRWQHHNNMRRTRNICKV